MKKISSLLILIFTLSFFSCFFISSTVYASPDQGQLDEIKNTLTGQEQSRSVLGQEPKKVVLGLSKEVLDIFRVLVIAGLAITGFKAFSDFKHIDDNPQLKAKLKVKLMGIGVGILCVMNFWTIYDFLAKINIKLGG